MRNAAIALALSAILLAAAGTLPSPVAAVSPANCTASPSNAVVGTTIVITCTGFDTNVLVNTYVVEPTGFTEWGKVDYWACLLGNQSTPSHKSISTRTDSSGTAVYVWYTQNGKNTCPAYDYNGYANQVGTYTVVVQELDGKGGIKTKGTTQVTLMGMTTVVTGATLVPSAPTVAVFGKLSFTGGQFGPGEGVNLWFTRPSECSGIGSDYWTGVSAFDPKRWGFMSGVKGPGTVFADGAGGFAASYVFGNRPGDEMPCLGTWSLTARGLKSGATAIATFQITGGSVPNNATLTTLESMVPSIGQTFFGDEGIGVHVNGSGFPAGAAITCWFTRPDGTTYVGFPFPKGVIRADGGSFSAGVVTESSAAKVQGEQLGRWAVSCGTVDLKVVGTAWFMVIGLPDP